MKSSNPQLARVVAEINIHEALAAVEHFAANFPEDRQSFFIADRLNTAATTIMEKAQHQRFKDIKEAAEKRRAPHAAPTSRFDSSKPNYGNTPKEQFTLTPDTTPLMRGQTAYCDICQTPGCPCCFPSDATGFSETEGQR